MPRLARDQETAFRRVSDAAAAGLSPERLGHALLAAIQIAIPVDGYRLFGIDPATRLINRTLAASETDGWARLEWLQTVYLAHDPIAYVELSNLISAGIPVAAFQERQETCWGYPRDVLATMPPGDHYRLFHTMNSPAAGGIQAEFQAHGRTVAALQIYRRDALTPFRASDVAFLRLLRPDIGAALGASLDRERALRTSSTDGIDATGVLMLSRSGAVSFATPAGEHWSDRLRAAEALWTGRCPPRSSRPSPNSGPRPAAPRPPR